MKIIPLNFFKMVFSDDLRVPVKPWVFYFSETYCSPVLFNREVPREIIHLFCRKFFRKNVKSPQMQFMKMYQFIGGKRLMDIIDKAFTHELELQLTANKKQAGRFSLLYSPEETDYEAQLNGLKTKFRALYESSFELFEKNLFANYEKVISTGILKDDRDALRIKETLIDILSHNNIEYDEEDIEAKEKFLLLGLSNASHAKIEKLLAKPQLIRIGLEQEASFGFLRGLSTEEFNSYFFRRLPDLIYSKLLGEGHFDFLLFFEEMVLPNCFYSLAKLNKNNIVAKCKSILAKVFMTLEDPQNVAIHGLFMRLRFSPSFIDSLIKSFNKTFMRITLDPGARLEKSEIFELIKADLFRKLQNSFALLESIKVEHIRVPVVRNRLQSRGANSDVEFEPLLPEMCSVLVEFRSYLLNFSDILISYFEIKKIFYFFQNKLRQFPDFLFSKEGLEYVEKVKDQLNRTDMLDVPGLVEKEFKNNMLNYSLKILEPTRNTLFKGIADGINQLSRLYFLRRRQCVFGFIKVFIELHLKSLDIHQSVPKLVHYMQFEFSNFLDIFQEFIDFYFSEELGSEIPEQELDEIASIKVAREEDRELERAELDRVGAREYLLASRVANREVYTFGLLLTLKIYFVQKFRNPALKMEDYVEQYNIWTLVYHRELLAIKSIYDPRVKLFDQLKIRISNFFNEISEQKFMRPNTNMFNFYSHQHINQIETFLEKMNSKNFGREGVADWSDDNSPDHLFVLRKDIKLDYSRENVMHLIKSLIRARIDLDDIFSKCGTTSKKLKRAVSSKCLKENPNQDCVTLNNFLIRSECPFGEVSNGWTDECLPPCPANFRDDSSNPLTCWKPDLIVRKIKNKQNNSFLVSEDQFDDYMDEAETKGSLSSVVSSKDLFLKVQRDFRRPLGTNLKSSYASMQNDSNVFARKFEFEGCPSGFEEMMMFCVPVCPNGWVDQGRSCKKLVTSHIRYYLVEAN